MATSAWLQILRTTRRVSCKGSIDANAVLLPIRATVSSRGRKPGSLEGYRQVPARPATWTSLLGPGAVLLQPGGRVACGLGLCGTARSGSLRRPVSPIAGIPEWTTAAFPGRQLRPRAPSSSGKNSVCLACLLTHGVGRSGPGRPVAPAAGVSRPGCRGRWLRVGRLRAPALPVRGQPARLLQK